MVSADAAKVTTGSLAVQQSKRDRKQQETVTIASDNDEAISTSVMRSVGTKTFYLRDNVWTDSEFKADARQPETTLTFGSDEYFDLLRREPRLAEYFALGERVVVVYQGRVYRVNAAKK
jgi:hypothetical protein